MRIETDDPVVASIFSATQDAILTAGGFVPPSLCLHQAGTAMWASCDQDESATPAQRSIFVPENLLVPINDLKWERRDSLQPTAGLDRLTAVQRKMLEQLLALYECTKKLDDIQARLPVLALSSSPLESLLAKGFPLYAEQKALVAPEAFIGTRMLCYDADAAASQGHPPMRMLMPLIDTFNHHVGGAKYTIGDGGLRVKLRTCDSGSECFAHYGYKDSMVLLLRYGYVSHTPLFFHSIACEIISEGFGRLTIKGTDHNPPLDLPWFKACADGLEISHMNIDAEQPHRSINVLKVLARGVRPRATPDEIERSVQQAWVSVVDANRTYYGQMLAQAKTAMAEPGAAEITRMLAEVAEHQLQLLTMAEHNMSILVPQHQNILS